MSSGVTPTLPPGQFNIAELEGCRVVTEEGIQVGTFLRAEPGPAQDLWVVRSGDREHLIPAVAEIVVRVDLSERIIVVRPPEGLFEV